MKTKYNFIIINLLLSFFAIFFTKNIYAQNNTPQVGTLPGSFSVSPSGAAIYSIPIDIPEGRGGMTPSLTLVYNSQGGRGDLGIGWAIGGLSAINRVGKDYYHDNKNEGIKFLGEDGFVLDGQRLILINSGQWQDEYRTETESFSKIIAYHNSNHNPQRFKIWTKDGKILEYGFTDNSSIEPIGKPVPYQWKINKIEDRLGNYIDFQYVEDYGMGHVKKIKYTGNSRTGMPTYYEIDFNYMTRLENNIIHYIEGYTVTNDILLDNITINYENQLIKTYELQYDQQFNNRLLSIKVTSDDNITYINPTLFEWGSNNHNLTTETINENNPGIDYFFLDINGDGLSDIIYTYWTGSENNIKEYTAWNYKLRNSDGNSFGPTHYFNSPNQNPPVHLDNIYTGDYNGDGLQDFITVTDYYGGNTLYSKQTENMFLSNGTGFNAQYIYPTVVSNMDNMPVFLTGDFDGDGITEFMLIEKANQNGDNAEIWKRNIENHQFEKVFNSTLDMGNTGFKHDTIVLGDFNGDGKTDILRTAEYGGNPHTSTCFIYNIDITNSQFIWIWDSGYPTVWHRIFTGDFNGDGITDILTYNYTADNPQWEVNLFNGRTGWEPFYNTPPISHFDPYDGIDQYWHGIKLGDLNGDGTTDIIEFEKQNIQPQPEVANYSIYYSNGFKFDLDNTVYGQIPCIGGLDFFGGSYIIKHNNYYFGPDFNGDGRSDIFQDQGYYDNHIFFFDKYNKYQYMKTITNGLGNKNTISYSPLTKPSVYTKGNSAVYPIVDIQVPLYVVDTLIPDNDIGNNIETVYHYTGARAHQLGKGFLGFSQIETKNFSSNTLNKQYYSLHTEYINNKIYYYYPFLLKAESYSIETNVKLYRSSSRS